MSKQTGFLYHEICMWHDPGNRSIFDDVGIYFQPAQAYENAETKRRLKNLLEVSGVMDGLQRIDAEPASIVDLKRYHTSDYIDQLERDSAEGAGDGGEGSPFAQGGFFIARQSAGMAIKAVESVLKGEVSNAYSLGRPPGHHAKKDSGSGFCLLANIPIAILAAMDKGLVERVAVIDWDVHHGNGTQDAFYDRNDVLTISLHHDNNFPPDSGAITEQGEDEGFGYNLNVPLPAGSGIGAYMAAMEQVVVPALARFKPELIIVACGFDAAALDPLGPMILNSESYRAMTEMLMTTATNLCEGKLVYVHEGGYSDTYVPFCGLAVIEALSDQRSLVKDSLSDEIACWGQQDLQEHQQVLLDNIKPLLNHIG